MAQSDKGTLFPDHDEYLDKLESGVEEDNQLQEKPLGSLTKAELAQSVAFTLGLPDAFCRELVVRFFEKIKNTLLSGEDVKIAGLGTFSVRQKYARPGRNPKTGEDVTISPRKVVTFKASRQLRDRVNQRTRG